MGIAKVRILQNNFNGGAISPLVRLRTDLKKFPNSVQEMVNFNPLPQGAARLRYGFEYCCTVSSADVRLVPFIFNTQQNYILIFGDQYIRILKNGELVSAQTCDVVAITQANPAVVTYAGTDFANGDKVMVVDVEGMVEINRREFVVANVNTGSNTLELTGLNSSGYTAYTTGGRIYKILEVATPYIAADLEELSVDTQSGDYLYIFHASYAPRQLIRTSDSGWGLSEISFRHPPTYEKDFDIATTKSIIALTRATTIATLTCTAHGYSVGNKIEISGCTPDAYNGVWTVATVPTADTLTFTLSSDPGADASGVAMLVSGSFLNLLAATGTEIIALSADRIFYDSDIGRSIISGASRGTITDIFPHSTLGAIQDVSSLTRSGMTATVTSTGHGYSTNNWVVMVGADQHKYNGVYKITVSDGNTFTYTLDEKPTKKTATGSIKCYLTTKSIGITNITATSGEVVVTTTAAHGFLDDDFVRIKKSTVSEYNKKWTIYDVTATTFTFFLDGATTNDATGNGKVFLLSPTNVVSLDIKDDFTDITDIPPSEWALRNSPSSRLTFGDTKENRLKHGSIITITANRSTFRSNDIGKYIKFLRGNSSGTDASYFITEVQSSSTVKAEIMKRMHLDDYPTAEDENPTVRGGRWYLESPRWSVADGYPEAAAFFLDRLWVARDDFLWASEVGNYDMFLIGADDDQAIEFVLGSRQINKIKWIVAKKSLFIGTTGGEWRIDPVDGTITPSSPNAEMDTNVGSHNNSAILTPYSIVYPQLSGYRLREIIYDFSNDAYMSNDLTLLFSHLFTSPVKRLVFLSEPYQTIMVLLDDGSLIGIVYQKEHEIVGAYQINSVGDVAHSIATIYGSSGNDFYAVFTRENGIYVERLVG